MARGHKVEARLKRRAQIVRLCWERIPCAAIARRLGTTESQVRKWRTRFREGGVEGLHDKPRPGKPCQITPAERVRVLGVACRDPAQFGEARTTWSLESLARVLVESRRVKAISKSSVHRILEGAALKPHRVRMWCTSTDPDYDRKLADITTLYLEPPPGEPVLCIDEKTGIQALGRIHALKRPRPGKRGREEFEYRRNGTRCLFACFNVRTGHVLGRMTARRAQEDFLAFLDEVARTYRQGVVHVVLDNLNTHKSAALREWNRRRGNRFRFHYTPTHASWLNQVEIFFGILVRRVLNHASYGSTKLLDRAIERFLKQWNEREAHPFRWTYRQRTLVA
jgi:transposase